jgi:hypothetical protein
LVVRDDRVPLRIFQSRQAIKTVIGVGGGHTPFGKLFEVSLLTAS